MKRFRKRFSITGVVGFLAFVGGLAIRAFAATPVPHTTVPCEYRISSRLTQASL